jgi:hypothetical protein
VQISRDSRKYCPHSDTHRPFFLFLSYSIFFFFFHFCRSLAVNLPLFWKLALTPLYSSLPSFQPPSPSLPLPPSLSIAPHSQRTPCPAGRVAGCVLWSQASLRQPRTHLGETSSLQVRCRVLRSWAVGRVCLHTVKGQVLYYLFLFSCTVRAYRGRYMHACMHSCMHACVCAFKHRKR